MAVSRRRFIQTGAAAVIAGCVPVQPFGFLVGRADALTALTALGGPRSIFDSSANFRPHIGAPFVADRGGGRTSVLLLKAVDDFRLPGTVAARRLKTPGAGFTLLFDGSRAQRFTQSTYSVRNAALGTFDIFLTPVGMSTDVQAVINRLH
jgi:hypothetical protein